jgi:hypothetical protein
MAFEDGRGRSIPELAGTSFDQMQGLFSSMISDDLGAKGEGDINKQLADLEATMSELTENFADQVEGMEKYVKAVKSAHQQKKDRGGGGITDAGAKTFKDGMAALSSMLPTSKKEFAQDKRGWADQNKFQNVLAKWAKGWTFHSDPGVTVSNTKALAKAIVDAQEASAAKGAKGGGGGGGGRGGRGGKVLAGMFGDVQQIAPVLSAGVAINKIFDNAIIGEYQYIKNMREIAYQTEGITGSTEALQDTWTKLANTVKYTGVTRNKFQQAYMKNLKKGIKSQEQSFKVTRAGLFLGKQIGANTAATADMFHDWHMNLQLTDGEMQAVAQSAKQVAMMTGVTGDNLVRALRTAEKFMGAMRDIGSLSVEGAEAVMGIAAEAQKLGVDMNSMMEGITAGPLKFWKRDSKKIAMFLGAARMGAGETRPGLGQRLVAGTATSAKDLRAMSKGMNRWLSEIVHVKDAVHANINALSAEQLERANFQAQVWGFKGFGDLQRKLKMMEDGTLTFTEKLANLKIEMSKVQTTEEAMNSGVKRSNLFLSQTSKVFAAMDESLGDLAKEGGTLSEAFDSAAVKKMMEDNKENLAAMFKMDPTQVGAMGAKDMLQKTGDVAMKQLEELARLAHTGGLEIDKSQIQKLLKSTDPKQLREGISLLQQETMRVQAETEAQTDPVKETNRWLKLINDKVGQISASVMTMAMGVLGPVGIAGIGLGMASGMFRGLGAKLGFGGGLLGLLKGPGGKAIAGAAAKITLVAGAIVGLGVGIKQAMDTGKHATEIFQKSMEELTLNEKWAAEGAGLLTGILNFLTFGIFRKALGPMGTWTQALAKSLKMIPLFTGLLQVVVMVGKVIWGVLKGLWEFVKEVFYGLWEGVKAALVPLKEVWDSLVAVWNSLAKSFKGFGLLAKDTTSVIDIITGVLKAFGKAVGWVLKVLGHIVGWVLRRFTIPIQVAIHTIGGLLEGLMVWLNPVIDALWEFAVGLGNILMGIGELLDGIFTDDPVKMEKAMEKMWKGLMQAVSGFLKFFFNAVMGFIVNIPTILEKTVRGLFSGIGHIWEHSILQPIKDFPLWFMDEMVSALSDLGNYIWDVIVDATPQWLQDAVQGTAEGISWLGDKWNQLTGGAEGYLERANRDLSFQQGGVVPGGGAIPILAHGGELIIPKEYLGDGLRGILKYLYGELPSFQEGGVVEKGIGAKTTAYFSELVRPFQEGKAAPQITPGIGAAPSLEREHSRLFARKTADVRDLGGEVVEIFKNKDIVRTTDHARVGFAAAEDSARRFKNTMEGIGTAQGTFSRESEGFWSDFFSDIKKGFAATGKYILNILPKMVKDGFQLARESIGLTRDLSELRKGKKTTRERERARFSPAHQYWADFLHEQDKLAYTGERGEKGLTALKYRELIFDIQKAKEGGYYKTKDPRWVNHVKQISKQFELTEERIYELGDRLDASLSDMEEVYKRQAMSAGVMERFTDATGKQVELVRKGREAEAYKATELAHDQPEELKGLHTKFGMETHKAMRLDLMSWYAAKRNASNLEYIKALDAEIQKKWQMDLTEFQKTVLLELPKMSKDQEKELLAAWKVTSGGRDPQYALEEMERLANAPQTWGLSDKQMADWAAHMRKQMKALSQDPKTAGLSAEEKESIALQMYKEKMFPQPARATTARTAPPAIGGKMQEQQAGTTPDTVNVESEQQKETNKQLKETNKKLGENQQALNKMVTLLEGDGDITEPGKETSELPVDSMAAMAPGTLPRRREGTFLTNAGVEGQV